MQRFALILAAALACAAARADGPKDEFHDMPWGSKPTASMQHVDAVHGVDRYRETDGRDMVVLGVETSRVLFHFVKGAFCGAEVHWDGVPQERRQTIWTRLAQYWGPGGKKDPHGGATSWLSDTGQTLGVYSAQARGEVWDITMTLTALKCRTSEAAGY